MIPVFQPIVSKSDIKSVVSAIKKGEISGSFGENIKIFEKNFANFIKTKYSVAVSSGTTALHLAVAVCKFSKGSEIIISATTNIATALAVVHNNCIPVPIDSDPLTWNLNVKKIEERITKKTKAIIIVHFLGNPVDMEAIQRIAKKYNLILIEDAAEAHGAEYKGKKVGSFGHFGCFSLYANKVITCGEGGIITTNSISFFEKIKLYRNLGFTKPRFKHYISGYNFRMTGYQAAFANNQLKSIKNIIKKKIFIQKMYEKYLSEIKFIRFQKTIDESKNIYWMTGILISSKSPISKKLLIKKLIKKGIETRSFFMSMREQPCLKIFFNKDKKNSTPVSNNLWKNALYLPSSHNLNEKKIKYICNLIKKIFS
jgi:perosamine synthetase